MQLTLDTGTGTYNIRAYEPGKIVVNETTFISNLIVSPAHIVQPWQPANIAALTPIHLQPIFALKPEIVLLGTGPQQLFPPPALLAEFYRQNIGIEVMNTGAACRTYNVLMAEGRQVAAALFL